MVFNSYSFICFFIVIVVITRLNWSWIGKKTFLLLASYFFYACWNPPFIILLWISTIGDWIFAKQIHNSNIKTKRRLFLCFSLILNLGMLGYFKYANFFIDNFIQLSNNIGLKCNLNALNIILPVGISFYTFQTLSYTLDIYFKKLKPWHSFLDYALFVTFFPQLVAGPIVRASEFLPQLKSPCKGSAKQLYWGIILILTGLFNKIVIADSVMSYCVEYYFDSTRHLSFITAWCAATAFTVQLFCDFAGYSACAIGAALCLGFNLPDNFRSPLAARGISDIWRSWHITLMTWFRDYLYIPMGGSRNGWFKTARNILIVMFLSGLWHGASWNFVIWGLLLGLWQICEHLIKAIHNKKITIFEKKFFNWVKIILTFMCFSTCFVFFRSGSLTRAVDIVKSLFGFHGFKDIEILSRYPLVLPITVLTVILHRTIKRSSYEDFFGKKPFWFQAVWISVMMLLVIIFLTGGRDDAFFYFQF